VGPGPDDLEPAVRAELEATLARHPHLGLVSCAPTHPGPGFRHLRLRPLLVLLLPLHRNSASIQRAVAGDCGNPLFVHAATRTAGPFLARASALAAVGVNASQLLNLGAAAEVGLRLWEGGWAAAAVGCDHLLAPTARSVAALVAEVEGWGTHGTWAGGPAGKRFERLHGLVERRNGRMVEERMGAAYPLLTQGPGPRPPPPPPLAAYAPGITVVVMTFATSGKASAARRLLTIVANLDFSSLPPSTPGGLPVRAEEVVREVVLLWNGGAPVPGGQPAWTPPKDFLAGIPRARLVLAPTNDLQNRMNMGLVAPSTAAVMALDDDSAAPSAAGLLAAYRRWAGQAEGTFANVGLDMSRGPPIVVPKTSVGNVPFCAPVLAYLGHPHCVGGRAWVVENPFIYHQHWAESFSAAEQAPLRAFVRAQPSHPDDLAFGTFVNWASGQPAYCSDQLKTSRRLLSPGAAGVSAEATPEEAADAAAFGTYLDHSTTSGNSSGSSTGARGPRQYKALSEDAVSLEASLEASGSSEVSAHGRRLLSGGPDWLFLRSHGAMWVLFWFGGFHAPKGCWVNCRAEGSAEERKGGQPLAPRYTIPEPRMYDGGC